MKISQKNQNFIYKSQALGLLILGKICLLMGLHFSSGFFGFLFMIFGPFMPPTFLAMRNLKLAMPKLTFCKRFKILIGMWNNLGRNLAEFIWFYSNKIKNIEDIIFIDSSSRENLDKIKNNLNGDLILTAHFGNWEAFSYLFEKYSIPLSAVYREMNNKYADNIIFELRKKNIDLLIPKGKKGVTKLIRALKEKKKILMLIDQRLSNGITVPFFNIPSKTTESPATFALKYNYKLYVAFMFRRSFSCYFDLKIEEIDIKTTGDLKEDIIETTKKINDKLEESIRIKPEQWFWVHNRWKDENKKN